MMITNTAYAGNTSAAADPAQLNQAAPVTSGDKAADAANSQTRVSRINKRQIPGNRQIPDELNQQTSKADKENSSAVSVDQAMELTREMNEIMDELQTSLGFSIREELNRLVVVEIKNRETDELIKQIPAEELLKIKEKMEEFTGLLFDQNV